MGGEQYLRRYRRLRARIKSEQRKQEHIRELCEHITKDMSEDKVQSSGVKDRLSVMVAKLVDLESETADLIDESVIALNEIEDKIARLEDPDEIVILHAVYIDGQRISEIARDNGKSEATIYRKKRHGIEKISEMIGNERY